MQGCGDASTSAHRRLSCWDALRLLQRLRMTLRNTLVASWDQRAAVMDAAVRQRRRSLSAVDTLDGHTAVAGWTTLKSVTVQGLRLVEAESAPCAVNHYFAGLG